MNSKAIKRQLLAAIAMVLVAAIALGSSTYAWFVASGTVTATGMNVTVQSEGGIMIRSLSIDGSNVTGGAWGTVAESLNTNVTRLFPTSTTDLTSWVHASSAHADDADAKQDASKYMTVAANQVNSYRRLDTFAIRSSSGQDITNAKIRITEVTASVTNATTTTANLNKAIRVGVRVDTNNGGRAPTGASEGSAFYVYAPNLTGNFTLTAKYDGSNTLIEKNAPGDSDYIYMKNNTIPGAEAGVRVEIFTWYEGEDENCKNTSLVNGNDPLTPDNLNISVKFAQDTINPVDLTTGVTVSSTATQAKAPGETGDVLTNYYAITGKTAPGNVTLYSSTSGSVTKDSIIVTISGNQATAYTNVIKPST